MPLTGVGTIPSGAVGNELLAVTRRRFMPAVVVQIGKARPWLAGALAAAEPIGGGVSPVTVPVQTGAMTGVEAIDYAGGFTLPSVQAGIKNAEFNLKAVIGKVPYYLLEGMNQQEAAIVPLLWARMNDLGVQFQESLGGWLAAPTGTNTILQPFSFFDVATDVNPAQALYGNLDRVANPVWKGFKSTIAAITGASTAISRTNVLAAIMATMKNGGGAKPSAVFVSLGFWMALASDIIGAERYVTSQVGAYGEEAAEVAFPAIMMAGDVPVYGDPSLTDSTIAAVVNWDYLQYKIHQDATFAVIGPADLLPVGQLAYVLVVLLMLELVCTKPATQGQITGWTGAFAI